MSLQIIMLCQWICLYMHILFISVCIFMSSWCPWVLCLIYFHLFACLLMILTLSMLKWSIKWVKSYFSLSHVSPKPYWSATYSIWSGSCLIFCGDWVAFHGHVCWYVITCEVIWFVITYNMSEVSYLALLHGSNMILFLPPVPTWCITIIFPSSVTVCNMHLWVQCT